MIELFMFEDCPYCRKVMDFMNNKKVKYKKIDAKNHDNSLKLLTIGGKEQVPFLYNPETDDRIYESDDIIEYIRKRV